MLGRFRWNACRPQWNAYCVCLVRSHRLGSSNLEKTVVYECEFFAVSVAFDVWAHLLQGKLIACKSCSRVASYLLEQIFQEESDASIICWFARVPSKNNIADDPSRGHTSELKNLKCSEDLVDKKRKIEWLDAGVQAALRLRASRIMNQKKGVSWV